MIYNPQRVMRQFGFERDMIILTGELANSVFWYLRPSLFAMEEIEHWLGGRGSFSPDWPT